MSERTLHLDELAAHLADSGRIAGDVEGQLQPPKQTDTEAANSATPDTDRLPSWDDEGWDSYLYAVDLDYRVDWDLAHGASREDVQAMIDDWRESHDDDE